MNRTEPAKASTPTPSLPEAYKSIPVPAAVGTIRKIIAFTGPGYLVAVGYMDPGNWATAIAGGSAFGYTLLSVVMAASLAAILMQALSARLGIASGRDLAQLCRERYSKRNAMCMWILAEVAICACDLAELIGTAIALNLLFGIPLMVGIVLTVLDVLLILMLQNCGFRYLEAFIISLLIVVGACFAYELVLVKPEWAAVVHGFVPSSQIVMNPQMLYIAIGILGATIMPHNIYLHSSIVQTRNYANTTAGKREAVKYSTIDSTVALTFALCINASILILAAAAFHTGGQTSIVELKDAHAMLTHTLGAAASLVFAIALLASGQNSTITGTLAGQIVMEGFLNIRLPAWVRRMLTRLVAIVPAVFVTAWYGESGTAQLLTFSQVILSLQLPFAIVPLIQFTSDRKLMAELVAPRWLTVTAYLIAALIISLNIKLIFDWIVG